MSKVKIREGREGEDIACGYLKKKGYKIIDRNFRLPPTGEIDIIAIEEKENVLVFVEVKARRSFKYGMPIEAVTQSKLRSIVKVAQYYKAFRKNLPEQLRIDAISIIKSESDDPLIEHFQNVTDFNLF